MERLNALYHKYSGEKPLRTTIFPASGSNRQYYRLEGPSEACIGVVGSSLSENKAFCYLSNHFHSKGINVPIVFSVNDDNSIYLQQDLGDKSLFDLIKHGRESGLFSEQERALLRITIGELPKIQFEGAVGLDFEICYPQASFDERSVSFDLNYFKYCFLKTSGLEFDEIQLDNDFKKMSEVLLKDSSDTFMYRDFQSRNVMIYKGKPYFIDFQGGRKGPIYYDVASFIWQAKANFPEELRQELLITYLDALKQYVNIDLESFYLQLRHFVLFRTLQVLGAYGYRGYFEKKPHFIQSIPFAIENLSQLLKEPFIEYPYLSEILNQLVEQSQLKNHEENKRLEVKVYSFSYKKGIPNDLSGNGGGFVFDCRALNNPGRYEYYHQFTGMDQEVKDYLEEDGEVYSFLDHCYALVDKHVERFMERQFTHLQVSFGCTGGQHRSVYCAEHLAAHLLKRYDIDVCLVHREQGVEKQM